MKQRERSGKRTRNRRKLGATSASTSFLQKLKSRLIKSSQIGVLSESSCLQNNSSMTARRERHLGRVQFALLPTAFLWSEAQHSYCSGSIVNLCRKPTGLVLEPDPSPRRAELLHERPSEGRRVITEIIAEVFIAEVAGQIGMNRSRIGRRDLRRRGIIAVYHNWPRKSD